MIKAFYLFLLLCTSLIYSQEGSVMDSLGYIESFSNKLNVKIELDNDIESFKFDDGLTSYNIVPNTSVRTSISAHTRFLTLRFGYSPKFLTSDNSEEKGNTEVLKINLNLFMKNWMQTFETSSVMGYYVDAINGTGLVPNNIILPNLRTFKFKSTTNYKFNKNLSFKAIFNQNDIQRKSAGSIIPTLTYQYLTINDDSGIQDTRSSDIFLNVGYFYTFVINKKWYANIGLSPGLGIEFNKLKIKIDDTINVTKSNELIFNINTFIGLGYNSKNFFSGFALRGIATTRNKNSILQFNTERAIFLFSVGYRFNTPKFIDKAFDWIENINPNGLKID